MTETAITPESIFEDWKNAFPELGKHGTKKLLRVVGPIAIGIELNRIFPKTYRPEFTAINLADDAYPKPLPLIYQLLRGRNRVQVSIKQEKHSEQFASAVKLMREQAVISFDCLPNIEVFIHGIIKFIEDRQGTNCFVQYKAIAILSRFLEDNSKRKEFFTLAMNGVQILPKNILEAETNGFERWAEKIEKMQATTLKEIVESNIQSWKMTKLPRANFNY